MHIFRFILVSFLMAIAAMLPARAADDAEIGRLIDALGTGGFEETSAQVAALAATGDARVAKVLELLSGGDLYVAKDGGAVVAAAREGKGYRISNPLTGADLGVVDRGAVSKIKINNRLRGEIKAATGALTLSGADPAQRMAAADTMFKAADPGGIEALDAAIAQEKDAAVAARLAEARAAAVLASDAGEADKLAAVDIIKARGDRDALAMLRSAGVGEGPVAEAATKAGDHVAQVLSFWEAGQNVWYGLSLGSVLLLAAIGLAITFGVMGVINMAHGEMVMLGAYTTFVVQELIRTNAPWLFDYSLFIALPLAFLVSGVVGMAIERGVLRFLYGRPLETLLATWGLSLIIQQAVRTVFGPTNREVGNPSWMSGAFDLGHLAITWNRLWIIVFALAVFAGLLAVMRRTAFGLEMRAVTQNRRMAGSMGIRTPWVDALTFALGSGIAGVAGVALSQIDNVSPNLGQGYIIDSFMVVVFGGVGNLWGTLVGAMTLGVVNKFVEPYAGAVLGKILVLVFIILFIQKRPRGLFALKGRAVEA
ncbi:MAG: urea ABC transporter permease subunit UrtB [Hyphomicrobiales bacterium]